MEEKDPTIPEGYVRCAPCQSWDWARRAKEVCATCNNSLWVRPPADSLCNLCGGHTRPMGTFNENYPHGLENMKIIGGYESYHLLDMNEYVFSLCEECLRKIFMQCKIPPTVIDRMGRPFDAPPFTFAEDQRAYEYRVWKDNGGHHQAYLNRKCNAIKECPNDAIYTLLHNSTDFTEECLCEEHKDYRYSNSSLVPFIRHELKAFL